MTEICIIGKTQPAQELGAKRPTVSTPTHWEPAKHWDYLRLNRPHVTGKKRRRR